MNGSCRGGDASSHLRKFGKRSALARSFPADAAATAIGVTPDIFKSTLTAKRNGVKFDLLVAMKDQAEISKGSP